MLENHEVGEISLVLNRTLLWSSWDNEITAEIKLFMNTKLSLCKTKRGKWKVQKWNLLAYPLLTPGSGLSYQVYMA